MKHFYRFPMPNGLVYQVPVEVIGQHRVQHLVDVLKKTVDEAIADTAAAFMERSAVIDWARDNMSWASIAPHVSVAAVVPHDFEKAWRKAPGVVTALDEAANIGVAELRTIPVTEMFRSMELRGEACVATTFADEGGKPLALAVLVQGTENVELYLDVVKQASAALDGAAEPPNEDAAPAVQAEG